jgi:hypothetical protein
MHIPKTAGISFYDCLERLYPGEHFLFSPDTAADLIRYRNLDPARRRRITLFGGHTPRTIGEEEIDGLPVITMLRNPVSRVKSFCQHIRDGKSAVLRDRYPPEIFDLDRFLDSGMDRLENLQTRLLLGRGNFRTFTYPDGPPDRLAEAALAVLTDDLICFGLTELFEESLMLFRRRLKWGWPEYQRLNPRNEANLLNFEKRHIEKIRRLNAVDLQVYRAAASVFQSRWRSSGAAMDLIFFRLRRRLVRKRGGSGAGPVAP